MLELNNLVAPFDNKLVRQAVAYATPYQDIIDQIYLGQAAPGKSLVPALMPTSDFSTRSDSSTLTRVSRSRLMRS